MVLKYGLYSEGYREKTKTVVEAIKSLMTTATNQQKHEI